MYPAAPGRLSPRKWAGPAVRTLPFEGEVAEHGFLEDFPGAVGVGDAMDGTLGGAGVGGTEALEGGPPAKLPPLFFTATDAFAKKCIGPGDPNALECVDGPAGRIAELSVVERN